MKLTKYMKSKLADSSLPSEWCADHIRMSPKQWIPATQYCLECRLILCDDCMATHKHYGEDDE